MDPVDEEDDIVVQIAIQFEAIDVCSSRLTNLARAVCKRFRLSQIAVGIAIVDDAQIRELNKRFLKHDRPTDCLSFDLSDDCSDESNSADSKVPRQNRKSKIESRKLFELIVNGEMAVREAKLRGHGAEAELALYITHGLLHKLGFDDSTPQQARQMHQTEDEILQRQGFGLVYNNEGTKNKA